MRGHERPISRHVKDRQHLQEEIPMTNSEDKPPPAVGAYWIKEEDYPALLQLFDDGDKMPPSWKEWLKVAEEMERGLKAYGHVVLRVYIDPATFPDWCAAQSTSPGSAGRRRGGGHREIWPTGLTGTLLAGRRPIVSPPSKPHRSSNGRPSYGDRPTAIPVIPTWLKLIRSRCRQWRAVTLARRGPAPSPSSG